jgi:hypothetical protein
VVFSLQFMLPGKKRWPGVLWSIHMSE